MGGRVTASIVTIGNELLSGDTVNTNAAWLPQQLEDLGVVVTLMASLPDEIERVAEFVRTESDRADIVLVTGGLGGTPDDITREAIAAAFEAPQDEVADLAASLRSRFPADPEYAARWANLPRARRPPPACGRASRPTLSPRPGGRTSPRERARSRTRSAARPASSLATSTSCPAC